MKKKLKLICGLFAVLLVIGGCFSPLAPVEINYYDLNMPEPAPIPNTQISIESFENRSGAGEKMRYRTKNNQQLIDEQNRWIQFPEEMLTRYLNTILGGNAGKKAFRVRGQLEVFEIDLTQNSASLQCSFTIFETGAEHQKTVVYRKTFEFKEQSPQHFAVAFSNISAALADKIKDVIKNWDE